MINIYLFNFSKKDNSTAYPATDTGSRFRCAVKTGSSIISPVVELSTEVLPAYNYAYIPNFKRWYFITNATFERGLWVLSLACDVLASYKKDIGATAMYFERASAGQNVRLKDTMYPITGASSITKTVFEQGALTTFETGCVCVTVLSSTGTRGIATYFFTPTEYYKFCDAMLGNDIDTSESVWDSVSESIKITMYEPLRYIGSVYWFPNDLRHSNTSITQLKLGNYEMSGFTCYRISSAAAPTRLTYSVPIPKHPQTSSHGKWVNLAPCTEYSLQLPPFGTIQLDTTAMMDASTLNISITMDALTGACRCVITTNTNATIADLSGQWGVPIQVASTVNNNMIAGAQALISAGVGAFAASTGNYDKAVSGALGTVRGIGDMIKGSVSISGSTGSVIDHQTDKVLYSRFFTVADDDNANAGRPYCKIGTPATLRGFLMAQKGLVQSEAATRPELDAVNAYMEGGFYFE